MDWFSTAQANAFSLIYGPSNFDQSSPSDTRITHVRYKAVDYDQSEQPIRDCFLSRNSQYGDQP